MVLLNADDDFVEVIDGLEGVTLARAAGGTVEIDAARLVDRSTSDDQPPGGGVLIDDLLWDLPMPSGQDPPSVGDDILHGGEVHVVLKVERRGPGRRCRCAARWIEVSEQVGVLVDLQSPVWEDLGSGPEVTGWSTIAEDALAHIQPVAVDHDYDAAPTDTASTFTVSLSEVEGLELCEKVVAADGAEYRVDRILDDGRLDALPVLQVTRTLAAA